MSQDFVLWLIARYKLGYHVCFCVTAEGSFLCVFVFYSFTISHFCLFKLFTPDKISQLFSLIPFSDV